MKFHRKVENGWRTILWLDPTYILDTIYLVSAAFVDQHLVWCNNVLRRFYPPPTYYSRMTPSFRSGRPQNVTMEVHPTSYKGCIVLIFTYKFLAKLAYLVRRKYNELYVYRRKIYRSTSVTMGKKKPDEGAFQEWVHRSRF